MRGEYQLHFVGFQKKPELTERQRKKQSIEETKKSLPIYKYKKDLLKAIEEHQVFLRYEPLLREKWSVFVYDFIL